MESLAGLLTTSLRPLRSGLYTNAAYLWLGTIAIALLGFAFWTVVARVYPPEIVGLAGAAITTLTLLADVSQLGLGYALIRFLPQSQNRAPLLLSRSLVTVAVASLLAGLVFLGTVPLWSQDLKYLLLDAPGHAGAFLTFVVFVGVAELLRFTFIAYRRAVFVLVLNLTIGALRIPLAVLLGALGSAFEIVAGHGLAVLAGILLVLVVLLPRCTGWRLHVALDLWRLAPVASYALSNLVSNLSIGFSWLILPLLVIALTGAQEAGFFYVGWAVAGIFMIMTQMLALSLFAEGSYDIRGFRAQARQAVLVGIGLGGLFTLLTYFLGDMVLRFFGGEYVEQSSSVLKVLAAATPLAAVTSIYLGIERVRGRMGSLVAVSAVVAVVMLGVTVALVPRVGIAGAGYGVLAGYGMGALLSLPLLWPMVRPFRGRAEMAPAD